MKAFVLLSIRTGDVPEVVRHLKRLEQVTESHMTFGPYDAIAVVETTDINQLGRVISNTIQPIPGVLETLTCLAVNID